MSSNRNSRKVGWILGFDLQDNPDGRDGHSLALGFLTIWITLTIGVAASNFNAVTKKEVVREDGRTVAVEVESRDPWRSLPFYWLLTTVGLTAAVACLRVRDNRHSISRHYFDTATVSLLRFSFRAGIMILFIASVLVSLNLSPGQVRTEREVIAQRYTFRSDKSEGLVVLYPYRTSEQHIERQRLDSRYNFEIRFQRAPWFSKNWKIETAAVYSGVVNSDSSDESKQRQLLSVDRYALVSADDGKRYVGIQFTGFDIEQPLTIELRFARNDNSKMSPQSAIRRMRSEKSRAFAIVGLTDRKKKQQR